MNTTGFTFVATDCFTDFRLEAVDHFPIRPQDMNMGGRVIVRKDHDPQAVDAQDRRRW